MVFWVLGGNVLHQSKSTIEVPFSRFLPGARNLSRHVSRLGGQRGCQGCLGQLGLAQTRVSGCHQGQEFRPGRSCSQLSLGKFIGHFLELPLRQHGTGEFRYDLIGRKFQLKRFAQLNLCTGHLTGLQQDGTQQKSGFGRIRAFLQRVLDLDDGSFVVVFCDIFPGRCQHRIGAAAATPSQKK